MKSRIKPQPCPLLDPSEHQSGPNWNQTGRIGTQSDRRAVGGYGTGEGIEAGGETRRDKRSSLDRFQFRSQIRGHAVETPSARNSLLVPVGWIETSKNQGCYRNYKILEGAEGKTKNFAPQGSWAKAREKFNSSSSLIQVSNNSLSLITYRLYHMYFYIFLLIP